MSRGREVPVSETRFVDWRGPPAVGCGSRAWAVLPPRGSSAEVAASAVPRAGRASSAEELGDRYFEILRGAGGFDALARVMADQATERRSARGRAAARSRAWMVG